MEGDIKKSIEYLEKRLSLLHRNYQFAIEQAIENLIKGYRELEQENRHRIIGTIHEIKIEDLEEVLRPYYIPKLKIKEKIEEIIRSNPAQDEEWDGTDYQVTSEENYAIEILEDLLEG